MGVGARSSHLEELSAELTEPGLQSLFCEALTPHPPALRAPSPTGRRAVEVLQKKERGLLLPLGEGGRGYGRMRGCNLSEQRT